MPGAFARNNFVACFPHLILTYLEVFQFKSVTLMYVITELCRLIKKHIRCVDIVAWAKIFVVFVKYVLLSSGPIWEKPYMVCSELAIESN